jgi:hypothetical protein
MGPGPRECDEACGTIHKSENKSISLVTKAAELSNTQDLLEVTIARTPKGPQLHSDFLPLEGKDTTE